MRKRIIFGGLTILALVMLFWFDLLWGGYFVCLVAMALTAAALHELFAMTKKMDLQPFRLTGIAFGAALLPYYLWSDDFLNRLLGSQAFVAFIMAPLFALILALMGRACTRRDGLGPQFKNIAVTVFGVLYVALPMAFLVRTRFLTGEGWDLVLLVIAVAKAGDSGAYFTGVTLGRHKLAPRVSPNKTVEGAVGGLVASMLAALAMVYLLNIGLLIPRGPVAILSFGLVVGVAAQAGDLTESLIKRSAEIKDSGRMLPVLGGVLDLIDSLLVAAPVAYFVLATFAEVARKLGEG